MWITTSTHHLQLLSKPLPFPLVLDFLNHLISASLLFLAAFFVDQIEKFFLLIDKLNLFIFIAMRCLIPLSYFLSNSDINIVIIMFHSVYDVLLCSFNF